MAQWVKNQTAVAQITMEVSSILVAAVAAHILSLDRNLPYSVDVAIKIKKIKTKNNKKLVTYPDLCTSSKLY